MKKTNTVFYAMRLMAAALLVVTFAACSSRLQSENSKKDDSKEQSTISSQAVSSGAAADSAEMQEQEHKNSPSVLVREPVKRTVTDTLEINGDAIYPDREKLPIAGVAQEPAWDAQKLLDQLWRTGEIEQDEQSASENYLYRTGFDGELLTVQDGALLYKTPRADRVQKVFRPDNEMAYPTGGELDFISAQGAYDQVANAFNLMGISVGDTCTWRAVDLAAMQQQLALLPKTDKMGEANSIELTADDACYFFDLITTVDGVPVSGRMIPGDETVEPLYGITRRVLYSKDGIEYLEAMHLVTPQPAQAEKTILPLDEAIELLPQIGDANAPTVIDDIRLEYFPSAQESGAVLSPVWVFLGSQSKPGGNPDGRAALFLDALTGEKVEQQNRQ